MTDDKAAGELSEQRPNRQLADFQDRLREAVRNSGGPSAVSRRSGVPLSTLNSYLSGQSPKWASITAIAKACGISMDWLAEGYQPSTFGIATGPAMPLHPGEPPNLYASVNLDLLAAALQTAMETAARNNILPHDWHTRAKLLCVLYDGATASAENTDFTTR